MNDKNLKKSIIKFKFMVKKNYNFIKRIIFSEDFINKLYKFPELIEIEVKNNEIKDEKGTSTDAEIWYLFGIEAIISRYILKGCVFEMLNEEWIVIKGI